MDQCELLSVEDSFLIRGRGVVLIPDFSIPEAGWENCQQALRVELPDGSVQEMLAHIDIAHFNITDPEATPDQKWRVTVRFVSATEKVPVGSKVFAPREVCDALVGA